MRVRGDLDQRVLSELFFQYLNVEEDFIRALFTGGETQLGPHVRHETALPAALSLHVLDHERATEVIATATPSAWGCATAGTRWQHLGRACDAPMDICMTFNTTAASLVRHGVARGAEAAEALDLLDAGARAPARPVRRERAASGVNFMCNCCGCCCEAMIAARRFGHLHPVHTTNYLPEVARRLQRLRQVRQACPVDAMALVSAQRPEAAEGESRHAGRGRRASGCGVCVGACARRRTAPGRAGRAGHHPGGLHPQGRLMAIERGDLARPDLRQPRPGESPRDGGDPRA